MSTVEATDKESRAVARARKKADRIRDKHANDLPRSMQPSALVKTMTGYAGYNQNLVIDRIVDGESVPFEELPIEGVVEFWFENMKAFDECYGTPAFKRTGAHGAEFIDNITTYLVEAKPIAMEQA